MGKMTRLRNFEYIAERPAPGFGLRASASEPPAGPSASVDRSLARDPPSLGMTELGVGAFLISLSSRAEPLSEVEGAESRDLLFGWDRPSPSFHENSPL